MAEEDRGFLSRLFGGRDDAPEEMPTDFFSLPMGANPEKDRVVGMDESGLPQYESPLGVRYIIRPTMPEGFETEAGTLARVAEVGRDAIEGTIDGVVSGFTGAGRAARGEPVTYGDTFATAGTASLGGAASSRPAGSVGMGGRVASDELAETPAQTVARLLREDRAQEVTDDLLAQTDPQEMYRLYEAGDTGVDLPMDEASRMARAREAGFTTGRDRQDVMRELRGLDNPQLVHYTNQDFSEFRIPERQNRQAIWATPDPSINLATKDNFQDFSDEGVVGIPVMGRMTQRVSPYDFRMAGDPMTPGFPRNVTAEDVAKANSVGADYAEAGLEYAIFDPSNVRSRFARFDPRLSGNANLLAANRDATTGIMATQAGSKTPDDFGYYQDNPALTLSGGDEWLAHKQKVADDTYERRSGITGSTTATLGQRADMFLPTDFLRRIPGLLNERRASGEAQYDALLRSVQEKGFLPNQDGNKVLVGVNHRGEPYLIEGNTRVAVASDVGVPNVKAEVHYFNGGEMVDGQFAPNNFAQIADPEPLPAAKPQEFNRGGLVLSDATKGIRTAEGIEMANKKFQLDRSKADQDGDGDVSKLEEVQGEAAQRTVGKDDLVEMACGGIMMPDMDLDPISGNEVPLGSTPENVRDDIPAMLSQDEYVLPAHVVKWHGLKHIQEMQMEAEAGLMSLSMEGLIGGVEEAAEVEAEEYDTMEDEYVEDMDVEVDVPTVEVEDELEGEEYEEEPLISALPGMMKKQKYAFIIS